jgi:glycine dehydrogenase subunit 1
VPAVVQAVVSRSEFATAYTPYQPEVSQGSLQAIYEFQSAICLLTEMEVANASIYDGPTACAEAALMACRLTERQKILISDTVNSEYSSVTETYIRGCDFDFRKVPSQSGITDAASLPDLTDAAALVIQYPNFFGCLEDLQEIEKRVHAAGALLIVVTEPISLGLLAPPGKFGADIVVGDAQACGNFLSYGGPSAGYMACRQEFVRQLPGRLAGKTRDIEGKVAYTLTLQTREQHIRRARATSNICTNQALNALAMLVYLTALGPSGLQKVASISLQRAHYLARSLAALSGVRLAYQAPFFNEFAIITSKPSDLVLSELLKCNILGGLDLSKGATKIENGILIAVTETNSRSELDHYVNSLKLILSDDRLPETEGKEIVSLARFDEARAVK